MTRMYGPAVRCKRFRRSGRYGLASMYPASAWWQAEARPEWRTFFSVATVQHCPEMIPLIPVNDRVRPCREPRHSSNGFSLPFRSWRVSLRVLKLAARKRLADWLTELGTSQRLSRFQR